MCYLKQEQEFGILKHFSSSSGVIEYVQKLIETPKLLQSVKHNSDNMIANFINPTLFLDWFIENYPESEKVMRNNPEYQNNFK
jgi:hypothetical protein